MFRTGQDDDCAGYSLQEKSTQRTYCKYTLRAKVETMIYKNQFLAGTHSNSSKSSPVNLMSCDNIIGDDKKCQYFTGLDPIQFYSYWDETEKKDADRSGALQKVSVKEQLFTS